MQRLIEWWLLYSQKTLNLHCHLTEVLLLGLLVIEDLLIIISTNTKPWQTRPPGRPQGSVQRALKLNPFKIFINQIDGYFLWLENMVLYGTVKILTIKGFFYNHGVFILLAECSDDV